MRKRHTQYESTATVMVLTPLNVAHMVNHVGVSLLVSVNITIGYESTSASAKDERGED